jgi:hypothetical protein
MIQCVLNVLYSDDMVTAIWGNNEHTLTEESNEDQ